MRGDADIDTDADLGRVMNELLIAVFISALLVFTALWAVVRLFFDAYLHSLGLVRLTPQPGYGAIATGYGRALLLVVLTTVIVLLYYFLYARFLRGPLRERGIV